MQNKKWTEDEVLFLQKLDLDNIDIYDIADKLNRTVGSVCSKIYKLFKKDFRGSIIGSRKRAVNHYICIINRINNTDINKNKCYKDVKMLIDKEDFIKWFMQNDFKYASVDRIDKNKHYSFDNIQLIPLVENIRKDKIKLKNGKCECYVCHQIKPLIEFTKDNRRISGYSTICLECERIRCRNKNKKN